MHWIIDTDAGIDDAVAMFMAMHGFEKNSIIAITTVFGNVDIDQADHNASFILKTFHHTHIPIYHGAECPIIASSTAERWEGHGPDGLGGTAGLVPSKPDGMGGTSGVIPSTTTMKKNDAVIEMIELVEKYKGDITIIALGPLTNLALACLLDPNFMTNVYQIVVMGGNCRGEGNITPYAEFNTSADPEATDIVYRNSTRPENVIILPLEATHDANLSWKEYDDLFQCWKDTDGKEICVGYYIYEMCKRYRAMEPANGFTLHDVYTVAMLLNSNMVKKMEKRIGRVHLHADEKRGACLWSEPLDGQSKGVVTVVTEVCEQQFFQMLKELAFTPLSSFNYNE